MSAFSNQHLHPSLLLETLFFPNHPGKVLVLPEEPGTPFPQFPHPDPLQVVSVFGGLEGSRPAPSTKPSAPNEASPTNLRGADSSSMVLDQRIERGERATTESAEKKRKYKHGSSANPHQSKETREVTKGKRQKKRSGATKDVEGKKTRAEKRTKEKSVNEEEAPTGYIHVRARRGQATDSHSLAERVRREKISERMKLLQAIVPGCDKVTGKALVLDEIINYVQSLQNQVEFLSMKLASLDPMLYDFGLDLDALMAKPQNMSGMELVVASVPQCGPGVGTDGATASNDYPLLDSSASLVFHQAAQITNILSQGDGQVVWGMDEGRHKPINNNNQSGFGSNLCSFL